jgi:hypothetical protein
VYCVWLPEWLIPDLNRRRRGERQEQYELITNGGAGESGDNSATALKSVVAVPHQI